MHYHCLYFAYVVFLSNCYGLPTKSGLFVCNFFRTSAFDVEGHIGTIIILMVVWIVLLQNNTEYYYDTDDYEDEDVSS